MGPDTDRRRYAGAGAEDAYHPNRCRVARRVFPAGDSSLVGSEERVAVERKSLADFAQTVIRARQMAKSFVEAYRERYAQAINEHDLG